MLERAGTDPHSFCVHKDDFSTSSLSYIFVPINLYDDGQAYVIYTVGLHITSESDMNEHLTFFNTLR